MSKPRISRARVRCKSKRSGVVTNYHVFGLGGDRCIICGVVRFDTLEVEKDK